MLFASFDFVVFFLPVLLAYWLLAKRPVLRWLWLLGASYFFYAWWRADFAALLLFSTAVGWLGGRAMEKARAPGPRLWILLGTLAFNIGQLVFFKYLGFFARSFTDAFAGLGIAVDVRFTDLVLPVGISFYTFQSLT